jgi:signal transduction histidine kinase
MSFFRSRDAFNDMADMLESAQKEKARLEEARNRMFIDISHDLKTPMMIIGGTARRWLRIWSAMKKKGSGISKQFTVNHSFSDMIEDLFEQAKLDRTAAALS